MRRGLQYIALDAATNALAAEPTTCVPWTGRIDRDGYGRFDDRLAHREMYELMIGPIPEGLDLDHTCHVRGECVAGVDCPHRRCVNPAHLEPVTRRENTMRGNAPTVAIAARTQCKHGHEYTPENTRVDRHGTRLCRTCDRERQRAYQERLRAERSGAA